MEIENAPRPGKYPLKPSEIECYSWQVKIGLSPVESYGQKRERGDDIGDARTIEAFEQRGTCAGC